MLSAKPGFPVGQLVLSNPCVSRTAAVLCGQRRTTLQHRQAAEKDLDWEPDLLRKGPLTGPSPGKSSGMPPPPPPPPPPPRRQMPWYEYPFASRRNIALTLLGGSAALWLYNHKFGPVKFADKPDIDFKLAGFTDIPPEDFVYFKTPGGNWVAAAKDEEGRLFMIDQIGDLYYDSGDPEIGTYVMDTYGNLYNEYADADGERRITPVGNVSDLKRFKISEIAGVKLDKDYNVVAFRDGNTTELPPGSAFKGPDGKLVGPGELLEGFIDDYQESSSLLGSALLGGMSNFSEAIDKLEIDLNDPTSISRQIFDQTLLGDSDVDGLAPYLPDEFEMEQLAREVEEEMKRR